ncbi:MAG: hypothetical protein ACE5JL_07990, partial [Dehalococcoidia bacterium]
SRNRDPMASSTHEPSQGLRRRPSPDTVCQEYFFREFWQMRQYISARPKLGVGFWIARTCSAATNPQRDQPLPRLYLPPLLKR